MGRRRYRGCCDPWHDFWRDLWARHTARMSWSWGPHPPARPFVPRPRRECSERTGLSLFLGLWRERRAVVNERDRLLQVHGGAHPLLGQIPQHLTMSLVAGIFGPAQALQRKFAKFLGRGHGGIPHDSTF